MLNHLPKYFSNKAIGLYLILLVIVNLYFYNYVLAPVWWIFGVVEVVGFFYFSSFLTKKWVVYSPKLFTKKVFKMALIIRLVWVVVSYFFYIYMTGQPFEFGSADAFNYHTRALWIRGLVEIPYLDPYFDFVSEGSSDVGYPTYLTFIYFLTDNSILLARLIKAVIGAYMCVLVYRLATRNFDENVGRIAAIFCMLMPNLILYSGLHLKEVEMVFLSVWFVERADFVIRTKNYKFWYILPVFLIGLSLFFFRTVLGATAVFSFITAILFSKKQVISTMKRLVLATWILMAGLYLVGGRIATEVEAVWQDKELNQAKSLEWRATREGGNIFSDKLSKAVFAPLIFVIPFPTIVEVPGQENQELINGGNFVKNILAFFFIYSMILLFLRRKWRDNILLLTFTLGYLIVIAMSAFAQSERFHQPALPFLLIFAALGVTGIGNKDKKLFIWYLAIIFVAIILWSWFKLAGKGLL